MIENNVIEKLERDLKEYVKTMPRDEARYLVDCYYGIQDYRIQVEGQLRAHKQMYDEQPINVLQWFGKNIATLEGQVRLALKHYAMSHPVGIWSLSVCGIGPVISAGLLCHIDMDVAVTPGHIWSFAGLDPRRTWLGSEATKKLLKKNGVNPSGTAVISNATAMQTIVEASQESGVQIPNLSQRALNDKGEYTGKSLYQAISRRPWNERLKVLCWKIGESFVKVSSNPKDIYGKLYLQRKQEEQKKNANGDYAKQAAEILQRTPGHKQKSIYAAGRLPDGHIHSRCKRWVTKLFLSHWWEVAYEYHHGTKPPFEPYPIAHLGHTHKIPVPGKP